MQIVTSTTSTGASQWFPEGFVPEVIELLLATWKKLALPDDVRLETRITALFNNALEDEYTKQNKPWYVFPEIKKIDSKTGKEVARTDIRFYHRATPGQKLYFALEGKRLHAHSDNGTRPGYGEYVGADGMMCFVTGKYSEIASCGGMLGYVMDGKLKSASKGIAKAIGNTSVPLMLAAGSTYSPCQHMPKHPWNGVTQHSRGSGPFDIYHLLFSVPQCVKKHGSTASSSKTS